MADRLHCIEAGSSSDPTVVLLHGFGGSADVWSEVIDAVSARAHVIALDLPGHGGSLSYPNFGSPRVAAQAVAQELKLRGIDRFHVAGHSMGGAVACLMALDRPECIASLTLVAPGGFGAEINAALMQQLADAASVDDLRTCYEMMSGRGAAVSLPHLSSAAAMRAQPGQLQALALILSKILRDGVQGQLPLEKLAALSIPVHVLWGDHDPMVPVAQAFSAPEQFKKTILANSGHMLIDEAAGDVIEAFFAQLG